MKTVLAAEPRSTLHADLRQPAPALDDVHGGARGPEEPLPDAPRPAPRVLAGADGRCRSTAAASTAPSSPSSSARWSTRRRSTMPSSAGRTASTTRPRRRCSRPALPAEHIHIERFGIPVPAGERAAEAGSRAPATPPTRPSSIVRDGLTREIEYHAERRQHPRRRRRRPASRCRSRASRACAAPAAPSCSRARCGWSATSRSRSTRSRPASC